MHRSKRFGQRFWDFNALPSWHPAIAQSEIEGGRASDAIGCVRSFSLKDGGHLREQLLALSDVDHSFSYSILVSPMPVKNYVATFRFTPVTVGNGTFTEWWADFDVTSGSEDAMVAQIGDGVFVGEVQSVAGKARGLSIFRGSPIQKECFGMKLGFNLLLWTTHVVDEHVPLFDRLKAVGYDGVEIPLFEGEVRHYSRLSRNLKDAGLAATAVTVMPSGKSAITADAAERMQALDHLKWAIDCTAALGGDVLCGPFHQPLGEFSGVGPTEVEKSHCVEVHKQAAQYAAKSGIKLSVEPLNRFEMLFPRTLPATPMHWSSASRSRTTATCMTLSTSTSRRRGLPTPSARPRRQSTTSTSRKMTAERPAPATWISRACSARLKNPDTTTG